MKKRVVQKRVRLWIQILEPGSDFGGCSPLASGAGMISENEIRWCAKPSQTGYLRSRSQKGPSHEVLEERGSRQESGMWWAAGSGRACGIWWMMVHMWQCGLRLASGRLCGALLFLGRFSGGLPSFFALWGELANRGHVPYFGQCNQPACKHRRSRALRTWL